MNIFQQVFASVNPSSVDALQKKENLTQNQAAVVTPKTEKIEIKKKIDVGPKNIPKPVTRVTVQRQSTVSSPRKRQSLAKQMQNIKKKREMEIESDEEEEQSMKQRYEELQAKIQLMNDKLKTAENSIRLAEARKEELMEKNAELAETVNQMKQAASESNRKMIEMKLEFEDREAEREASWEFKVNELLMEIQALKETQ